MVDRTLLLAAGAELLAREAACLDERRWDDWLALFAPDCEYWVPTWRDEETLTDDPQKELSHIYYNSRAGLEDRVARLRTGKAPSAMPLRRTTHLVANILLLDAADAAMRLRSSWQCHIYDPHRKHTDLLFGHSVYELKAQATGWIIARRKTVLQNDLLPAMVDFYCL